MTNEYDEKMKKLREERRLQRWGVKIVDPLKFEKHKESHVILTISYLVLLVTLFVIAGTLTYTQYQIDQRGSTHEFTPYELIDPCKKGEVVFSDFTYRGGGGSLEMYCFNNNIQMKTTWNKED